MRMSVRRIDPAKGEARYRAADKNPRKPPINVRAVEILEELVKRQPPVTSVIEPFSNECAAGLAVLHRLAIKQRLSSPNTAEFFLELDESERSAYVASVVAEVAISGTAAPQEADAYFS